MPRVLLALLPLAALACTSDDYAHLYRSSPRPPSMTEESIAALDTLGPTIVDRGVNFSVYSERATRVDLALFEDPEASQPTRQFEMTRFGEVWNVHVEGVGIGQYYGYVAWGPNWPYDPEWYPGSIAGFIADVDDDGNRFNPNKLLIDPYAKAIHREHDWSKGSVASGPARAQSTFAAASKSVVVESEYVWSDDETEWLRQREEGLPYAWNEDVLYEVHLKGFTASAASGVDHPGTFRGCAEKVDYLADLGITAVELMPIMEKPLDGTYWGYQTLSFFAPELGYSSRPDPREVIDELKGMVDTLHQNGLQVVLDVVYNHTGEGGFWREKLERDDVSLDPDVDSQLVNFDPKEVAGIYSYRGLDNVAYYALSDDWQSYRNNTGVGNETRANHVPMRRLILDSLRWWVEEMHVDGFRFDLAPILGELDLDYDRWDEVANTVLQDIIDDPILQARNTRIIAEPWSMGSYGVKVGEFPAATEADGVGWGEWNGRFRDWWRAFVNYDDWRLNSLEADADGGFTMTASDRYYRPNGRRPYHSVNFVTVHDGFTMYDLFSFDQKENGCGPLNPTCCDDRSSPFCDLESGETNNRSRDWGMDREDLKRQLMRDLFVAMMISHGTPMLYGGDEWMRTQLGNNNAYSTRADNEFNWFDWGTWQAADERWRMHDFVRDVVRFRREHLYALAPSDWGAGAPFAWKSPANSEPPDWSGKKLMVHYHDSSFGPELAILINMDRSSARFTLPDGPSWVMLVDTQSNFDVPGYFEGSGADPQTSANVRLDDPPDVEGSYDVAGSSIVVLEGR
ncbi:MAG: glycosyl hydrolase [Deltaproteobacteria bacterium]|nr:glycosyl hydrolase [Deltaproteobacteria bacterium]